MGSNEREHSQAVFDTRGVREGERGNIIVIAMLVVGSLIGIAGVSALSVQSNIASAGTDRGKLIALYAAESGALAAMGHLRRNGDVDGKFGFWFCSDGSNNCSTRQSLISGIPGNRPANCVTGCESTYFSADQVASYRVDIYNNPTDSAAIWNAGEQAYLGNDDNDGFVMIRSTGYGPNNAIARIELHIGLPGGVLQADCEDSQSAYQQGASKLGDGVNKCGEAVDISAGVTEFSQN